MLQMVSILMQVPNRYKFSAFFLPMKGGVRPGVVCVCEIPRTATFIAVRGRCGCYVFRICQSILTTRKFDFSQNAPGLVMRRV